MLKPSDKGDDNEGNVIKDFTGEFKSKFMHGTENNPVCFMDISINAKPIGSPPYLPWNETLTRMSPLFYLCRHRENNH